MPTTMVANPSLYLLYVKQAVQHLRSLDKCIAELREYHNANLHAVVESMECEKEKLIAENPAYQEAEEILIHAAGTKKQIREYEEKRNSFTTKK